MALSPEEPAGGEGAAVSKSELHLIEARDAKERRCADCGKRTEKWKPLRRRGTMVIVCPECAAKPPPEAPVAACPSCGAPLGPADAFCGRCGQKLEYACPACGATMEPNDLFCGSCGKRLA